MVIFMMVNGKKIKRMDSEFIHNLIIANMQENG